MFAVLKTKLRAVARTRFGRDEKGVAAVEFALLIPIILALFIGTIEMSQAITIDRRVTQATSATADLIARTRSTTTNELDGIMEIVEQILRPYDPNLMSLTIANVIAAPDDETDTTVCWAYQHNGGADTSLQPGSAYSLPPGIVEKGDSVLIAEAKYDYTGLLFEYFVEGAIELTEKFYLKPRLSLAIQFNGQDCLGS